MWQFAKSIIFEVDTHIKKSNKHYYSDFYIGITNNVDRRLFWEHNVPKKNYWYIYCQALDEDNARFVESYYLKKWMQWGEWWGNGDWSAVYVYCYEISDITNQ